RLSMLRSLGIGTDSSQKARFDEGFQRSSCPERSRRRPEQRAPPLLPHAKRRWIVPNVIVDVTIQIRRIEGLYNTLDAAQLEAAQLTVRFAQMSLALNSY